MYSLPSGVFLFIGYSKTDEQAMHHFTHMNVSEHLVRAIERVLQQSPTFVDPVRFSFIFFLLSLISIRFPIPSFLFYQWPVSVMKKKKIFFEIFGLNWIADFRFNSWHVIHPSWLIELSRNTSARSPFTTKLTRMSFFSSNWPLWTPNVNFKPSTNSMSPSHSKCSSRKRSFQSQSL